MKWFSLLKSKCPKCGKDLQYSANEEMLFCGDLHCGFQIAQYRAERLCAQMRGAKIFGGPVDNFKLLHELNSNEPEEEKPFQYLDI